MKKVIALLLAALMCASMLACGGNTDTTTKATTTAAEGGETTAQEAEDTTEAPKGEPYQATLVYIVANDAWPDQQMVNDYIKDLTLRELNIETTMLPMSLSSYFSQLPLMLSAGDKLDVFSCMYPDDYYEAGYILDLSPYEDTLKDAIEICGYDDVMQSKHNGALLGIPTQLERTHRFGIFMRKDLFEQAGFTEDDIEHCNFDFMTDVYSKVKEANPDMTMLGGWANTPPCNQQHTDQLDGNPYGVLDNYGQTWEVTNYYESDYFKDSCNVMRDWYLKDFVQKDIAYRDEAPEGLIKAGGLFSGACAMKPDTCAEKNDTCGYDTVAFYCREDMISAYTGSGWALAGVSEKPEEAAKLLNFIFTSREFNDAINWGIEGVHWVEVEDNVAAFPEGMTVANQTYHNSFGFIYPNERIAHVWLGNDPEMYTRIYPEAEAKAWKSYAYGFIFDGTNVLDTIGALNNVKAEYQSQIASGAVEVEPKIEEFNEKLYKSGLQDVIDEKQAQLDAWKEANNK